MNERPVNATEGVMVLAFLAFVIAALCVWWDWFPGNATDAIGVIAVGLAITVIPSWIR